MRFVICVGLFLMAGTLANANGSAPSKRAVSGEDGHLIRIDAEAAARSGISTIRVAESRFDSTTRGFGRVLDPLPIVDAIAAVEASGAANAGAEAERRRMERLASDAENASTRDLENARTSAARARADLAMARARLVAQIGPQLARSPDLTDLGARFSDGRASLIRIDVAGSERRPAPERGATLTTYPPSTGPIEAEFVGPAAMIDAALPGHALLFLVTKNAPRPGSLVRADCRTADPTQIGVAIPIGALVYRAGRPSVFVEQGRSEYELRAVEVVVRADGTAFVSQGLTPGESVVDVGAQQLLSAEQLGDSAGAAE